MLEEEQLTAGPQHPRDLPQGNVGGVDRAQHEGGDDRVDRSVGEWQPFRRRLEKARGSFLDGPAHCAQMVAKAQGGRLLALGEVGAELNLGAQ